MIKYLISKANFRDEDLTTVCITTDDRNFQYFSAEPNNSQYLFFLNRSGMSNDQILNLDLDVWYSIEEDTV